MSLGEQVGGHHQVNRVCPVWFLCESKPDQDFSVHQWNGIPEKVLIGELKHAGFKVQTIEKDSPGGDAAHPMYCVVFLKR